MNFFTVGDLHGNDSQEEFYLNNRKMKIDISPEDIVFQLGDFGYIFYYPSIKTAALHKEEYKKLVNISKKKFQWFVILGNHENYDIINTLPIKEWNGGKVRYMEIEDREILFAERGEIYTINGKKFFTFGGAKSNRTRNEQFSYEQYLGKERVRVTNTRERKIYKNMKLSMVSYWSQEEPTEAEKQYGRDNLKKHGNKVHAILTHTGPLRIIDKILDEDSNKLEDPLAEYFNEIAENNEFEEWHFGHVHKTTSTEGKFFSHYKSSPVRILKS